MKTTINKKFTLREFYEAYAKSGGSLCTVTKPIKYIDDYGKPQSYVFFMLFGQKVHVAEKCKDILKIPADLLKHKEELCIMDCTFTNEDTGKQKNMFIMTIPTHLNIIKKPLNHAKRKDYKDFESVLECNNITCFYHFTDISNIASIKKYGGLYSWWFCEQNGIGIVRPGGGELSRELDKKYNLQNYVRLSFCRNHPMIYKAKDEGRIVSPVILKIKLDVAYFTDAMFSDMNATKTGHHIGAGLEDLKMVHFNDVKKDNHFDLAEPEYYQAEVLVENWIPIEYIMNI